MNLAPFGRRGFDGTRQMGKPMVVSSPAVSSPFVYPIYPVVTPEVVPVEVAPKVGILETALIVGGLGALGYALLK
jgi:hypothetical protein